MSLKKSKMELLRSAVSLSLCGALFVGGTLAYFTKTVSSEENVISTKKFDIALLDVNGNDITKTGEILFQDREISTQGSVEEKIKVENKGELNFNYSINLLKGDNTGNENLSYALQRAIVVYIDNNEVGSLYDILNGSSDELKADLEAGKIAEHTIEFKMPSREGGYDADTYSGKNVGNFTVQVVANEIK